MKQIDFANGKITNSILRAALPMLAAQILNLLYNIVDRIYIARIPVVGTDALGGVGICFSVIVIITAFINLYGSGGSPLFAIERGKGDNDEAVLIMSTSYFLLFATALILMVVGLIFTEPILRAFGASDNTLLYALPYMRIYLFGTFFAMLATGLNPFINAQGYASTGMMTVVIGAVANIILDPIFIFLFNMGVRGAALATIISQALSTFFVLRFLYRKADLRLRMLKPSELLASGKRVLNIISLGTAAFVMSLTNSLVNICCNKVLADTGGDLYVSIMTIVSSARQLVETPVYALTEGSSPFISFNYGARKPRRIRRAIAVMFSLSICYALLMWLFVIVKPNLLIRIFSSDKTLMADAIPAIKIYFMAFIFMVFQYIGQTVFKSLGKKKHAVFFSVLRKVVIVVPLTYLLPYVFQMGTNGVFWAEPISNVLGGCACFITMLCTVLPELRKMD